MSLSPSKGTCDGRNGRYLCCGAGDVWLGCKSRGQCKRCSDAWKADKKKVQPQHKKNSVAVKQALDQLEFRVKSREYYLKAIMANIERNGKCVCDNCEQVIPHPIGRHVCHIVGAGGNKLLYLDPRNNFILGKGFFGECNCGALFDDQGEKSTMRIYPKYVEVRTILNHEYYVI